jgi:hypothetical protein
MLEGIFNTTLVFLVLGCLIVLLLSFAAMVIFEWVSDTFRWRGKFLKEAITEMLDDRTLTEMLYQHPFVKNLYQFGKKSSLPNYIPSKKFAMALYEIICKAAPPGIVKNESEMSVARFQAGVQALPDFGLKETLEALLRNARGKSARDLPTMSVMLDYIQDWFNDEMDALARYYQRRTRVAYYVIGLLLAIFLNIDSGKILSSLWYQATFPQRQAILEQRLSYLKDRPMPENSTISNIELDQTMANEFRSNLSILDFPIGWRFLPAAGMPPCNLGAFEIPGYDEEGNQVCKKPADLPTDFMGWISKFLGMFATGAFIPVGASFLFNVMKKVTSAYRSGVTPPPVSAA